MTGTSALVRGHTLVGEGKAYEQVLVHIDTLVWQQVLASRTGQGVCSCGAASQVLRSTGRRKQWHREHKAEVLAS